MVLGDEQALEMRFSFKGASGLKCCCLCCNVILRGLRIAEHDTNAWMIPHTETNVSKIVFATDQSVLANVAKLQAHVGNVSKQAFEKMETALGLNHVPEGPSSAIF